MERLLADATKLTGVKYDIKNLSDVYEAIHVVQEELGITGTTAKESAETFSGSLASMKAAFSNVLGGLSLGQDIKPALNALAETTSTFLFNNFLPMVANILKGLPGAIATFFVAAIPFFLEGGRNLMKSFGVGISEGIDLSGIKTAIDTVIEAIKNAFKIMIEIAGPAIKTVVNSFIELWNAIQPLISILSGILMPAFKILGAYLGGVFKIILLTLAKAFDFVKGAIEVASKAISTAIKVITFVMNALGTAGNALKTAMTNAWNGMVGAISGVASRISGLVNGIKNTFNGLKNINLRSIGSAIMNGFLRGLKSAYESVKNFIKGIGKWIAKNKGPISYDRKLLIPAGNAIMMGLNKGLKDQFNVVKTTIGGMSEEMATIMGSSPINKVVKTGLTQSINYTPIANNQGSKLDNIANMLNAQLNKDVDIILNIDGKEVAKATYKYNQDLIDRDTKMKARRKGEIY